MQFILSLFNRVDTAVLAASAFIGAIIGIIKGLQFIADLIKQKRRQRKQNKQMPERIMKSIALMTQQVSKVHSQIKNINEKITNIQARLDDNDDATSTVMLQKLMWAYDYYVINKNAVPLNVRTALVVMFEQYTQSGRHNHVPSDFVDRIMECDLG